MKRGLLLVDSDRWCWTVHIYIDNEREDKLRSNSTYDGNQFLKEIVLLEKHIDLTKIQVRILTLAK